MDDFRGNGEITPELLHRFTEFDRPKKCKSGGLVCLLPPHSYTISPPLEAQCIPKRLKSFELQNILPFTPLGRPTLTSFYPLRKNYPLTFRPFYTSWQPNSYIILPSLNKLPPHFYTILHPLAAQLLHHFSPPWQPNSYINLPSLNKLPPHS